MLSIVADMEEGKRLIVEQLITEAVFLEDQMQELKKHPMIKIHPKNPNLQKITASGKLYREYLQTYTNIVDKICKYLGNEEKQENSGLREFFDMASEFMQGIKR